MKLLSSSICADLFNKLRLGLFTQGVIHSVFDTACNIQVNGDHNEELITLLHESRPMASNGIRISGDLSFLDLFQKHHIDAGDKVQISEQGLDFGRIDSDLVIDLTSAGHWDPKPKYPSETITQTDLDWAIEKLKIFLRNSEQGYGIVGLLPRLVKRFTLLDGLMGEEVHEKPELAFIADRLANYIDTYVALLKGKASDEKDEMLAQLGGKIIGFGQGLTPSMDDFLSGYMATILYGARFSNLSIENIKELNEATTETNGEKTTIVSAEMLRYAAVGQVNEFLRNILVFMFYPEARAVHKNQEEAFEILLEQEKSIGASSGLDTLYGVLVGCCVCRILKEEI